MSGLVVSHRQVPFARIDPDAAKEIFIRSVCVNEDSPLEYECIRADRQLCDKVAARLAHAGRLNTHALEESLVTFYMQRLPSLASLKDLDHFIRHEIFRALSK